MNSLSKALMLVLLLFGTSILGIAQQSNNPNTTQLQTVKGGDNPIYKITINVVERSTAAINYRSRSGPTPIEFKGTPLFPKAHGHATIETKKGYTEILAKFDNIQAATRYGPEYLTYVLWAITPEGRAV